MAPSPEIRKVRPEDYGPVEGDCTETFQKMINDVGSQIIADSWDKYLIKTTVAIQLSREYIISGTLNMGPTRPIRFGLVWQGVNKNLTELVYTGSQTLFHIDDSWYGLRFRDMSFRCTNNAGSFMYSRAENGPQDLICSNCAWRGTWNAGFLLDGNNINSEFGFNNCFISGSYEAAWMWSGSDKGDPQQDQFLNYWFNDCKVEYEYGDFLHYDRGGFIKVNGGSYIILGQRPNGSPSTFFVLLHQQHYDGVEKLAVRDVRFELRNSLSRVIYCEWGNCHITFDTCSDTANAFKPHSVDLVSHQYYKPACVRYVNCDLVGKHKYDQDNNPNPRQQIVYDQCSHSNNRTRDSFIQSTGLSPNVKFRDDADGIV
ncbi:hypothetical protein ACGFX8_36455 [Streptomyces sp. NPDC048362]|uniref:hypothetical protein n=1 Tax=Streptomyces sp. NPDC048362 TaxID=3365539 RepID=UPI0037163DA7